ncbi:MAG: hypothetical protein GYA36_19390 [Veillonellaceae bacterium]|nr:hypothetical protein [Veillonellaceae bacterium]
MTAIIFNGRFELESQAKNEELLVLLGQPTNPESDDWWKFVRELSGVRGVEVAKLIVYDADSLSVGYVWRVRIPIQQAHRWDSVGAIGGPSPDLEPAPVQVQGTSGYGPLDAVFKTFNAQRAGEYVVITGVPKSNAGWKEAATQLLVNGGAIEVAKVYAPKGNGNLVYWWRVVIPVDGLKTLENEEQKEVGGLEAALDAMSNVEPPPAPPPPPAPAKPKRKRRAAGPNQQMSEDQQAALRRWMATNKGARIPPMPGEKAALGQALQEYQARVKQAEQEAQRTGRITRFPLFNPATAAMSRLIIIEGVRDSGVPGFAPPGPGISLENLPPTPKDYIP